MSRHVDADALLAALYEADAITPRGAKIIREFRRWNSVQVVRCKNCKYRDENDFCVGRGWPEQLVPDDGFCNNGVRMDLKGDDVTSSESCDDKIWRGEPFEQIEKGSWSCAYPWFKTPEKAQAYCDWLNKKGARNDENT